MVVAVRAYANQTFINDIRNKIFCHIVYQALYKAHSSKVTLNYNSAGTCSTESPSFLPKITTQPIGQKESWQVKPGPSYPTTPIYTTTSCGYYTLPRVLPGLPSWEPRFPGVQNPAWPSWKPLTSSLCSPNHCPRSDPFLTEPPPSPQPDPHVMKGINMAKPPAQPSSFPAAPARPLID